jgi:hypothetical protein
MLEKSLDNYMGKAERAKLNDEVEITCRAVT